MTDPIERTDAQGSALPESGTNTAVVVGGGIAGLVSAWQLVRAGWQVSLIEASDRFGGCVQATCVGTDDGQQLVLDAGAESFAVRTPAVRELIEDLGLGEQIISPNPAGSWLYLPGAVAGDDGGHAVPAPRVGVLGIPGDLDAPEVAQALGEDAMRRAREHDSAPVDRWRVALEQGSTVTIGALVRDRMGQGVLATLVAPVVAGVHSAAPDALDVRTAAPGLLEGLVEHGSLARAVATQRAAAPPGAVIASLSGGMRVLTSALVRALLRAGVRLVNRQRAVGLSFDGAGWSVELESQLDGQPATRATHTHDADRMVIATDGPTAWDLLAGTRLAAPGPGYDTPPVTGRRPAQGSGVALVNLVVDHPGLDAAPRGTGLLVAPEVDSVAAKAMTHVSAKWDWARRAADEGGRHRHVLRLSYGRVTDAADSRAPGYGTPAEQLEALAAEDASRLTGMDLSGCVRARRVVRWRSALPVSTPEHRQTVEAVRAWVEDRAGLDVVGAWVAGTGLAAVVGDVRRRIR